MPVHPLVSDRPGDKPDFYYACPHCGWCSPLQRTARLAASEGYRHQDAKFRAGNWQPEAER